MTLTEFLLARIAEDEDAARTAAGWDRSGRERANGRWSRMGLSSLEDDEQRSVIYSDDYQVSGSVADHIARHDPARVLAECEAKRRIVDRHAAENGAEEWMDAEWLAGMSPEEIRGVCGWCTYDDRTVWSPCPDLRDLAAVYANHPDYREEWAD